MNKCIQKKMKVIFLLFLFYIFHYASSNINIYCQTNPDFENKLVGWENLGTAFENQPEFGNTVRTFRVRPEISDSLGGDYWRGLPHSIGHHGNYWITSYKINPSDSIYSNDSLCNLPTGSLRSYPFLISSDTISFLLGGNGGKVELWIQQQDIKNDAIDNVNDSALFINYFLLDEKIPEYGIEVMGREFFLTSNDSISYVNKKAVLRIIDSSKTGHINVDDFFFNEISSDEIINYEFRTSYNNNSNFFNQFKYFKKRDTNLPLWGFADTHGHWMNNEAFGKDLVFGKPYGDIETALQNCSVFPEVHNKNFNTFFTFFHLGIENTGYPKFEGWPKFNDILHQTMYVDWVRRAYLGGLRLLLCPMGNNTNLPRIMGSRLSPDEYSDTATVRREVEYLDKMIKVLKKEGWIDIAYSSDEAKKLMMQNKLVIIKGMEVDQPGGFLYLNPKTPAKNKKKLEKFVNYIYDNLGIRHVFPIHHCDNAFGGFSLYGTEFFSINNYHLKNTEKKISKNNKYVKIDSSSLTSFRLGEERNIKYKSVILGNLPIGNIFSGPFYLPPGARKQIFYGPLYTGKSNYSSFGLSKGHINKKGLSASGKEMILLMMNKGLIIDIDHMSMKSTYNTLDLLENNFIIEGKDTLYYPVLAGHTNFLEQQLNVNETSINTSSACENCFLKLKNEHAKTRRMLDRIYKLGGMLSPITEGDKDVYSVYFVNEENPGSSKTWAEAYLFALQNFGKKNIGLGTDMNGLVTQISPRFGPYSSYSLRDDLVRMKYLGSRKKLSYLQTNGVNYSTELKNCFNHRFDGNDVFTDDQEKVWQAIFVAHIDNQENKQKFLSKMSWINQQMSEGFKLAIDSILISNFNFEFSQMNSIKLASYIVAIKYEKDIKINKNDWIDYIDYENVNDWIEKIDSIYMNYSNIFGNNIPIKRCELQTFDGVKDFDFNIDGLAHYGLFPDFMQDLKNIGLSYEQLSVVFNSAGDFANMLERCEKFSKQLKNIK